MITKAVKVVKDKNISVAVIGGLRRPTDNGQHEEVRKCTNRRIHRNSSD